MTRQSNQSGPGSPSWAALARVVGRYALYTLFMAVMSVWLLELILLEAAPEAAPEEGLEPARRLWWLQSVLTGAATVTLLIGAMHAVRGRPWLLLAAALTGIAVTRELEHRWGEQWLPAEGWTALVVALALAAAVCLWWGLRWRRGEGTEVLASPAPGVMWAGALLVLVFGPIAGDTDAWARIMGEDDSHRLEWAIETMIQMLGYMLICLGSVELVLASTLPDSSDQVVGREAAPSTPSGAAGGSDTDEPHH